MNAYYVALVDKFAQSLMSLNPHEAYTDIRATALDLVRSGFDTIPIQYAVIAPRDEPPSADPALSGRIAAAYKYYAQESLPQAREFAETALSLATGREDQISAMDAVHLLGRINIDEGAGSDAVLCFSEEMDRAQRSACVPAFVRAIHEMSRAHMNSFNLVGAEFGFRFALDYYAASVSAGNSKEGDDTEGSDSQNMHAAISCLRGLADLYCSMESGDDEAERVIKAMASPFFSDRDESGAAFFEIRYLALSALSYIPKHQPILRRMVRRSAELDASYPKIARFLVAEAEYVAYLTGTHLSYLV